MLLPNKIWKRFHPRGLLLIYKKEFANIASGKIFGRFKINIYNWLPTLRVNKHPELATK